MTDSQRRRLLELAITNPHAQAALMRIIRAEAEPVDALLEALRGLAIDYQAAVRCAVAEAARCEPRL